MSSFILLQGLNSREKVHLINRTVEIVQPLLEVDRASELINMIKRFDDPLGWTYSKPFHKAIHETESADIPSKILRKVAEQMPEPPTPASLINLLGEVEHGINAFQLAACKNPRLLLDLVVDITKCNSGKS